MDSDALIDAIFDLAQRINEGDGLAAGILGDLCTAIQHGFVDDLHTATREVVMRFKEAHASVGVDD